MGGLGGQQRQPRAVDAITRRNSRNLSTRVQFISPGQVIKLNSAGKLVLKLKSDGGLVNTSGELGVLLDPAGDDFLTLSATGLEFDDDLMYSFVTYYG